VRTACEAEREIDSFSTVEIDRPDNEHETIAKNLVGRTALCSGHSLLPAYLRVCRNEERCREKKEHLLPDPQPVYAIPDFRCYNQEISISAFISVQSSSRKEPKTDEDFTDSYQALYEQGTPCHQREVL
jgi:hypothetical protein